MLTAAGYGNSGAYFNNSTNDQTRAMLGIGGGGKSRVSAYSVNRFEGSGVPLSIQSRMSSPSSAIIGWLGPRPVAFPLVVGWNYDTPLT